MHNKNSVIRLISIVLVIGLIAVGMAIAELSKSLGIICTIAGIIFFLLAVLHYGILKGKGVIICPNCGEKMYYKLPIVVQAIRVGHYHCLKCGTLLPLNPKSIPKL